MLIALLIGFLLRRRKRALVQGIDQPA